MATNIANPQLRSAWEAAVGGLSPAYDEDSLIKIEEDVLALYAMGTSEYSWGNLVYGVRVEQTDFSSQGTLVDENGATQSINASNDFTNILPSIHANFDLNEDLKLRLSASTGVSRPTYTEMRASQSVNVTNTPQKLRAAIHTLIRKIPGALMPRWNGISRPPAWRLPGLLPQDRQCHLSGVFDRRRIGLCAGHHSG
jgi:outer membrane receptor protein involved in Fe transport